PVDTLPDYVIPISWISFSLMDINDDNVNDLVFMTTTWPDRKVKIFFGGTDFDTIPDISFGPIPGATFANTHVLNDFDGDGRSELVVYTPFLPYSDKQFGSYYFYNTGTFFDTIPEYIIQGDSVALIRYDGQISSSGDINGDAMTDFTFIGYKKEN